MLHNMANNCMLLDKNNNLSTSSQSSTNGKQIKIGNYLLGTTIGKGNSAVVKLATHVITEQKVAIKMFDKCGLDEEKQLRLRREIDSMKRLKHKNIIRLYEIMETSKLICLVTEYAVNGEIYDYIIRQKRLSEREARYIFKQIVAAIHYCHTNKIVHRDIKVENLLLDINWQVKLADFGFSSTFHENELLDVYCGSPPYCAPELYLAKLYDGPKVDIWSLGVVLYVLVCGYLPFEAQSFNVLKLQVINGSYKVPFFLSDDCKNLLSGMLTVDSDKRFSIKDIMNHKWVNFDNELEMFSNQVNFSLNFHESDFADSLKINEINKKCLPDINVLKEIEKYNLNIEDIAKSVSNNEFDSNAGIYYLIEAKLFSINHANAENSLNSELQSYKHVKARLGVHYQSLFYKDPNFQPNKLSTLNNQIKLKLDLTDVEKNKRKKFNSLNKYNTFKNYSVSHEDEEEISNKRKISSKKRLNENKLNFSSNVSEDTDELIINEENEDLVDENENDYEEKDEEDDEMPIEELGRNYLSRYSNMRRHTIGTDAENNINNNTSSNANSTSNIIKSTECFYLINDDRSSSNLQQDQQEKPNYQNNHQSQNQIITINTSSFNDVKNLQDDNLINNLYRFKPILKDQTKEKTNSNSYLSTPQSWLPTNISHTKKVQYHHSNHDHGHNHKHHKLHLNHINLKPQRIKNRSSICNHEKYNYGQLLSVPVNNMRRASDGGSNISLFNQLYYNKQNSNFQNNNNNEETCKNHQEEDSDHIQLDNLNIYSEEVNANSNEDEENENELKSYCKSFKQRGSITSGIPIFSVTSTSGGTTSLSSKQLGSQSSEDEETNAYSGGSNSSMKYQRRSSKSRHEPYLENNNGSTNLNASTNYTSHIGKTSPPYRTRQREQSFSGTINERYNGSSHRGSEPNPFDLITANRSHFERIYYQSINKNNLPINEELKMLQQENCVSNEDQQQKWKTQHLMLNFSKLCCSKESTDMNENINDSNDQQISPKQSKLTPQINQFSPSVNSFNRKLSNTNSETPTVPINYIHLCNNNPSTNNFINKISEEHSPIFNSHNGNNNLFLNNLSQSNFDPITPPENLRDMNKIASLSTTSYLYNDIIENNNNDSLKNLHMIHEQNETVMHSSTSSSVCSSESTTPRLNRSYLMLDRRPSLEISDNDDSLLTTSKNNRHKKSNNNQQQHRNKIHHNFNTTTNISVSPTNQYFPLAQSTSKNCNDTSEVEFEMGMYITNNNNNNGNINKIKHNENELNNFIVHNHHQYVNLSRKNENSLINFNEKESEAILN